jgi:uncharacterized membrane protein YcaP (DUF421 family)
MGNVDWARVLLPNTPLLEIVARGTLMYAALFALLRIVLRRQAGTVGITDLLVVVLMADAAQNGLAGSYNSVADGIVLVCTIIFWSYAFDWLGFHFPFFQRFFRPAPLPLVRKGHLLRRNMRHELITLDELMSQIREQGASDLSEVESAFMEGDGRITCVLRHDEAPKR